ncbi:MAG TPA: hypothetical protein VFH22_00670 [Rhodocyclaceae bacterium]|nr:hypothetical protein [Rhodocyclaceae bacterium]
MGGKLAAPARKSSPDDAAKRGRIDTFFLSRGGKNGTLFLLKNLLQKRPQISCGLITVGISAMFR